MSTDPGCVFCRILRREAEASLVYRDDRVTAFLDIRPVNPGHILVVPNVHSSGLAGLDPATGGHLFVVGQRLAAALRRSGLHCEGVNLYLADGQAAGQEVFHLHLHVVPRFAGDGFGLRRSFRFDNLGRGDLELAAGQIRSALAPASGSAGGPDG